MIRDNLGEDQIDSPSIFQRPPQGSWKDRFKIYSRGYDIRNKEALEEVYDKLPRLLGEQAWNEIGYSYCRQYPSSTWNLSEAGYQLPDFFKTHDRSDLACFARLEKLITLSFHAYDKTETSLKQNDLELIDNETMLLAKNSCRLFESEFAIWHLFQDPQPIQKIDPGKQYFVVYRIEYQVKVASLEANEYYFLEMLSRHNAVADVISHFQEKCTSEEVSRFLLNALEREIFYPLDQSQADREPVKETL